MSHFVTLSHDSFVNLSLVRPSHARPGSPLTATLPRRTQVKCNMPFRPRLRYENPIPKWHFASQQIQIFVPFPTSLNFSFLPRGKNKKTKKEYLIAIFVRPQNLKYYGSITSMWKYFFFFLSPTLQLMVCGLSGIRTVGEFFYVIFFK